MSHNFESVLDNLSFYQTDKKAQEGWWNSWWTSVDKEQKSFISGVSNSFQRSTSAGVSLFQSASNRTARYKNFFVFLLISAALFVGAFMFLPVVLIFPQKFALMFSLGSLCMHVAMSYLKASMYDYVKALFSNKDNTIVSGVYFGSLIWTIYSAAILGSYIWVFITSGLQLLSLVWFVFSLFPGGTQGFLNMAKYGLRLCPCFPGESLLPF